MTASARRVVRWATWWVAAAVLAGAPLAAQTTDVNVDELTGRINQAVNEWWRRPPLDANDTADFTTALSINTDFSLHYKQVLARVFEMRLSHLVLADRAELVPPPPRTATADDIRREWRLSILNDIGRPAATEQFRREAAAILGPRLAAIVAGYTDKDSKPDVGARASALLVLTGLPGSHAGKVDALLFLLRRRGVDQGVLFLVAQELGNLKIDGAGPPLMALLKTKNAALLGTAARALGQIGTPDALGPLLEAFAASGDTTESSVEEARQTVTAIIDGLSGLLRANAYDVNTRARVVAALMHRVLTDPDRVVAVAAAEAVRGMTGYPEAFAVPDPEDKFQEKVERLREWWLKQPKAEEHYLNFFRAEKAGD